MQEKRRGIPARRKISGTRGTGEKIFDFAECAVRRLLAVVRYKTRAGDMPLKPSRIRFGRFAETCAEGRRRMTVIKIKIDAEPIPAARPQFGNGRAFQPLKNREYREVLGWAARQVMKDSPPLVGALSVVVKLFRRYEKTSRRFGDVDNHLKAIFDGLQGIVFFDDAQIVRCEVEKHTGSPHTEIEISPAAVSV